MQFHTLENISNEWPIRPDTARTRLAAGSGPVAVDQGRQGTIVPGQ